MKENNEIPEALDNAAQTKAPENTEKTDKQIQEERQKELLGDFEQMLKDRGINLAYAIIADPKTNTLVHTSVGQNYTLAKLSVEVARYFKQIIDQELAV